MTKRVNHNYLKQLSAAVYHNGRTNYPRNCRVLEQFKNSQNGFYSEAVYIDGEIVIVYRGTDVEKGKFEKYSDYRNDLKMLAKKLPDQAKDAREVYRYVKNKYGGYKINLTGHSLGGSLSEIVGSETGESTVTFNSFGTRSLTKGFSAKCDNIVNYGNPKDSVFTYNVEEHRGKVFFTKDTGAKAPYNKTPQRLSKENKLQEKHSVEDMGDIDSAVEYKGENISKYTNNLSGVYKNDGDMKIYASVSKDYYQEPGNANAINVLKRNSKMDAAKSMRERGNLTGLAAGVDEDGLEPMSFRDKLIKEREEKLAFYTARLAEDPNKIAEKEAKHVSLEELRAPQEARKQRVRDIVEGKVEFDEERNIALYENKKRGDNKIFTKEEIDSMSDDEKQKNREAILYQKQNIGVPTEEQAKKVVSKGGMVFVNVYTRSDGVVVKSYYRSK